MGGRHRPRAPAPHLTHEIAHFFDVYKDLEEDKRTQVGGFEGVDAAWGEIERSYKREQERLTTS